MSDEMLNRLLDEIAFLRRLLLAMARDRGEDDRATGKDLPLAPPPDSQRRANRVDPYRRTAPVEEGAA